MERRGVCLFQNQHLSNEPFPEIISVFTREWLHNGGDCSVFGDCGFCDGGDYGGIAAGRCCAKEES